MMRDSIQSKKKFSEYEDARIRMLVAINGPHHWQLIAKHIPGRTARQCRDRYKNYLIPGFSNFQWTKKEDELLQEKYTIYGPKWAFISQFFTGRNANTIKNRWNYYVSKHLLLDEGKKETAQENEEPENENNNNYDFRMKDQFFDINNESLCIEHQILPDDNALLTGFPFENEIWQSFDTF